jgi:hypothetical protein
MIGNAPKLSQQGAKIDGTLGNFDLKRGLDGLRVG